MKFICPRCKLDGYIRHSEVIETVVCENGHVWELTDIGKKERLELLKINSVVKCKMCDERIPRIDDLYNGFCSIKCIKQFKIINDLSMKDLNHICIWYYVQSLGQKGITEKEVSRLDKRCSRNKLIQKLGDIYN